MVPSAPKPPKVAPVPSEPVPVVEAPKVVEQKRPPEPRTPGQVLADLKALEQRRQALRAEYAALTGHVP